MRLRLAIPLLVIALCLGALSGRAITHYLVVLPTVAEYQEALDLLAEKHQAAQDAWEAQDPQKEYHKGVFDMCTVFNYLMNQRGDCNMIVAGAYKGGWYGMDSGRFVWPPEGVGND